jgi:hypothetical protein
VKLAKLEEGIDVVIIRGVDGVKLDLEDASKIFCRYLLKVIFKFLTFL